MSYCCYKYYSMIQIVCVFRFQMVLASYQVILHFADFSQGALQYFRLLHWFYTHLVKHVVWMQHATIMKGHTTPLSRWKREQPPNAMLSATKRTHQMRRNPSVKRLRFQRTREESERAKRIKQRARSASNEIQSLPSPRNWRLARFKQTSPQEATRGSHLLLARLRSESDQINRGPHPSLLEDNSRSGVLHILWPMWLIKYDASIGDPYMVI